MKQDKKYNQTEKFINKTFELAKKGAGNVSPNPLVGAILVKNGKIIGQGYHQMIGESHAEINAIESATDSIKGATLYCNLEPCCHFNKKTPPCAQRIIKEGIKKVFISNLDSNPFVSGKGVKLLKDAGIEVTTDVLKNEGQELNKFYFHYSKKKLPYITVKIAQSIDGFIYSQDSPERWITGKKSRKLVHQWRMEYDAVLVGSNTIIVDNPLLNVRDVIGRNPYRVILDGKLSISPNAKLFNLEDPEKTIIIAGRNIKPTKINILKNKGIKIIQLKEFNNQLRIKSVFKELANLNITSVLVEGGRFVFSQFISEKIYDEIKLFIAPKFLGTGTPAVKSDSEFKLNLSKIEKSGEDILLTYLP